LRPTLGVLSRAGIIPFAAQQDTGGPIGQSVEDVALLMDVLAGPDERDPITEQANKAAPQSYSANLSPDALVGRKIGLVVNPEFLDTTPDGASTTEVIRKAADDLRAEGASVVEVTLPDQVMKDNQTSLFIAPDMAVDLDHYFATAKQDFPADVAALTEPKDKFTFSDVVASKRTTPGVQKMLEIVTPADAAPEARAAQHREAQAARDRLRAALTELMSAQGLDALTYPTVSDAVPVIGTEPTGVNCSLASMAGYPALSVPAGFTPDGRPVGLELLGLPNSDGELLAMGYAYEQATEHHHAAPTVPALSTSADTPTSDESSWAWQSWTLAGVVVVGVGVLAVVLIRRRRNS
jgi:amidase